MEAYSVSTIFTFAGLIIKKTFACQRRFFCLLIAFANSSDPDQDRQNVGPDLDPNRLTLW